MRTRRIRRLSRDQLREAIRNEARRLLREDAEGGSMRLGDALGQVEELLQRAASKAKTIAQALRQAVQGGDPAARKIKDELDTCLQGLTLSLERIERAKSRAGG